MGAVCPAVDIASGVLILGPCVDAAFCFVHIALPHVGNQYTSKVYDAVRLGCGDDLAI